MRIVDVVYSCKIMYQSGRLSLRIRAWHVKMFPLTYTVQECLEEWCEEVGWKYLFHAGGLSTGGRVFYTFRVEVGMYEDEISTIIDYVGEHEI